MRGTLAALALACASGSASAFNLFLLDDEHALKWGGDTLLGTPGGIVTWRLIPDGTPWIRARQDTYTAPPT